MAAKGGVVGIYFMPFIGPGPGAPTIEMLMRQIEHAIKVCGVDHVGIGSDLSVTPIEETPEYLSEHKTFVEGRARRGISAPDESRPLFIPELNHPRRLEGVVRGLLQRKHSNEAIEKIIGGNFHRVLAAIWPGTGLVWDERDTRRDPFCPAPRPPNPQAAALAGEPTPPALKPPAPPTAPGPGGNAPP